MSKGWDNAMLKKLRALTGKGLSTSEIGKRLGMSKNAIVGKLNRLGWNAKAGGATAGAVTAKTTKKAATSKKAAVKAPVKTSVKKTVSKTPASTAKKATTKISAKKSTKATGSAKKTATKTSVVKTAKQDSKVVAKNLAMHQRIIQHSLEMANLKPNQCRWPIGDPDSESFHFCGEAVFVGKPYCYEHCKQAYQLAPPKKK